MFIKTCLRNLLKHLENSKQIMRNMVKLKITSLTLSNTRKRVTMNIMSQSSYVKLAHISSSKQHDFFFNYTPTLFTNNIFLLQLFAGVHPSQLPWTCWDWLFKNILAIFYLYGSVQVLHQQVRGFSLADVSRPGGANYIRVIPKLCLAPFENPCGS